MAPSILNDDPVARIKFLMVKSGYNSRDLDTFMLLMRKHDPYDFIFTDCEYSILVAKTNKKQHTTSSSWLDGGRVDYAPDAVVYRSRSENRSRSLRPEAVIAAYSATCHIFPQFFSQLDAFTKAGLLLLLHMDGSLDAPLIQLFRDSRLGACSIFEIYSAFKHFSTVANRFDTVFDFPLKSKEKLLSLTQIFGYLPSDFAPLFEFNVFESVSGSANSETVPAIWTGFPNYSDDAFRHAVHQLLVELPSPIPPSRSPSEFISDLDGFMTSGSAPGQFLDIGETRIRLSRAQFALLKEIDPADILLADRITIKPVSKPDEKGKFRSIFPVDLQSGIIDSYWVKPWEDSLSKSFLTPFGKSPEQLRAMDLAIKASFPDAAVCVDWKNFETHHSVSRQAIMADECMKFLAVPDDFRAAVVKRISLQVFEVDGKSVLNTGTLASGVRFTSLFNVLLNLIISRQVRALCADLGLNASTLKLAMGDDSVEFVSDMMLASLYPALYTALGSNLNSLKTYVSSKRATFLKKELTPNSVSGPVAGIIASILMSKPGSRERLDKLQRARESAVKFGVLLTRGATFSFCKRWLLSDVVGLNPAFGALISVPVGAGGLGFVCEVYLDVVVDAKPDTSVSSAIQVVNVPRSLLNLDSKFSLGIVNSIRGYFSGFDPPSTQFVRVEGPALTFKAKRPMMLRQTFGFNSGAPYSVDFEYIKREVGFKQACTWLVGQSHTFAQLSKRFGRAFAADYFFGSFSLFSSIEDPFNSNVILELILSNSFPSNKSSRSDLTQRCLPYSSAMGIDVRLDGASNLATSVSSNAIYAPPSWRH